MTAICYIGVELSAKTQWYLLAAEIITLAVFAVVALWKVYAGTAGPGSVDPSLSWLNPFEIPKYDALVGRDAGGGVHLLGLGQHRHRQRGDRGRRPRPGQGGDRRDVILVGIYVIVSIAAQAYAGPDYLVDNSDDVL